MVLLPGARERASERAGEGKGEPTVRGRGDRRPWSFGGRGGGSGGAGAGGAGGGEGEVCVVVCGKQGDSVYSGRSSAGLSHTFTRGLGRGVPGHRALAAAEPPRAACPLPSPPASLSAAAATAGRPACQRRAATPEGRPRHCAWLHTAPAAPRGEQ